MYNDNLAGLQQLELQVFGGSAKRIVYVRKGKIPQYGTFMIPGFCEPVLSMRDRECFVGPSSTIVYLDRRRDERGAPVQSLTTQTLSDQVQEVAQMISAYVRTWGSSLRFAVLHGHSMGAVIALRLLSVMRQEHPDIVWHVITEAPPPWERAPLWFSNKRFWNNGGWGGLRDALKALTSTKFAGKQGMLANRETLYQLYAGGQPTRDSFQEGYTKAVRDAPLAFMELAFKSGLGDDRVVREALRTAQEQHPIGGIPVWQVICFIEDRIFDWQLILAGVQREARVLTVHWDDGSREQYDDRRGESGPNACMHFVPQLPHVPSWGAEQSHFRRAISCCYQAVMMY